MKTALAAAMAAFLSSPAPATACDLALALAVDVSGSVDSREFTIQMEGIAEALRDPVISEALVRAEAQVMLVQWTGSSRQKVTIPWTGIGSFDDVDALAAAVSADRRVWRNFSTAIGEALSFTLAEFASVAPCKRKLIDVSGDGESNEGPPPSDVHAALKKAGVVVNAIAIEEIAPDLTAYFFENVITGEGAFVVPASGFAEYPDRIRRKLLREVTRQTAQKARIIR